MESRLTPEEAQAALASVEQSRSDIADRLYTPWWYHPALGLLVGGLITVTFADLHSSILIGVLIAYGAGLGALVTAYRRKSGVWLNGTEGGPKARRSIFRFFGSLLVVVIIGAAFAIGMEIRWTAPIVGFVVAVAIAVWGRHFDKVLRAELRETS
ncbi:hypothetical protein O1R50_12480 [Glycomyces luteolus]|uniref:Uncharacterized protein n=1 Tax=Glycomyces luteolus TaxID=2670330 RepID=A0A9X3SQR3_9ACTN|nr:hypothetical protein [Glycomyces luteolus]MDA1360446.1 hypothetical protein [Glycomyces luteolus]